MSSILKALKKLEEEKAAKQGQRVDITKDIFGEAQQPAAVSRWPFITAGASGILALGIVAYLFIAKPGSRLTPPPAPAETSVNAVAPSPAPVGEPRAAVTQPPQEATSAFPKPAPPKAVHPSPTKAVAGKPKTPTHATVKPVKDTATTKPSSPSRTPVISANHPAVTAPRLIPQQGNQSPPSAPVSSVMAPAQAPTVTVSGIAYNSTPADRMAMINGIPVAEGKSVNGVKVEEIMPDKVRFSVGQKSFEVPLGRSNQ